MKNQTNPFGFTLLEMLTAMAIIAVMISLLIPAIGKIQDTAHTVKQKAQFGAIEIALETFHTDTGDYPPSVYTNSNGSFSPASNTGYCGAQKLAEAIVGLDGFGFHSTSSFLGNRLDASGTIPVYYGRTTIPKLEDLPQDDSDPTVLTQTKNLKSRKGPYLELEKANAVKIENLYSSGEILNQLNCNTFVVADMFRNVKNKATGKKTGMPILYFRANASNPRLVPSALGIFPWFKEGDSYSTSQDAVYNVNENFPFYVNSPAGGGLHPMWNAAGRELFYKRIANPNFTSPQRPYRASSFILLSAGPDGLYGSPDDVLNIDENEK